MEDCPHEKTGEKILCDTCEELGEGWPNACPMCEIDRLTRENETLAKNADPGPIYEFLAHIDVKTLQEAQVMFDLLWRVFKGAEAVAAMHREIMADIDPEEVCRCPICTSLEEK